MIKVIFKDKLNPYRAESVVFETTNPVKASVFIRGAKKTLLYDHWQIKTKIGDIENDSDLLLKFGGLYADETTKKNLEKIKG